MRQRLGKDKTYVEAVVLQIVPEPANQLLVAAGTGFRVYNVLNVSVLRIHIIFLRPRFADKADVSAISCWYYVGQMRRILWLNFPLFQEAPRPARSAALIPSCLMVARELQLLF